MVMTKKKQRVTVLVTGSNAPGFPSIVRSLKLSKKYQIRIVATDWKDNLKGRYYGDAAYVLPDNKSPEFIEKLALTCKKERVDVLLPIRTDDQLPICRHLEEFHDVGTIPAVVTVNPELMEAAMNKLKLLDYLKNVANLPVLQYDTASTKEALLHAITRLGYPEVPVAVKPAHASGSRGFRVLDPHVDRKKLFFDEKPSGIYTTMEELLDVLGETFPTLLVMEYLREPEYTVDVLCYKGRTFAIIPRRRLRMIGGITVDGRVEKLPEAVDRYIKKIVESFGFSYSVGMQFRKSGRDSALEYHLLEINPRLQGTTVISVAAGVNIPELVIDMAFKRFDFNFHPNIKYGLTLERTYHELFSWNDQISTLEELRE